MADGLADWHLTGEVPKDLVLRWFLWPDCQKEAPY